MEVTKVKRWRCGCKKSKLLGCVGREVEIKLDVIQNNGMASSGMLWEEPVAAPPRDAAGAEVKAARWEEEGHGKITV